MGCLVPSQVELVRPAPVVTEELQGSEDYNVLAEITEYGINGIWLYHLFFYFVYPLSPTEPAQQATLKREVVPLDLGPVKGEYRLALIVSPY
jgi:hypothetical protein